MFSVKCIEFITSLNINDSMFLNPFLVIFNPLFKSSSLFIIAIFSFALKEHFYSIINNLRLLQDQLSNILPTMRALLLSYQTLIDALLTE
jgi:hypothetical protein